MSALGDLRQAGIEADGSNVQLFNSGAQLTVNGPALKKTTVTTDTTAGASTYTAAQLLGGYIRRDPSGADRSDVSPTAALIIAACKQYKVGTSFEFVIQNTADANEQITLTAGTGVTLTGNVVIKYGTAMRFLAVITSSSAVTIYSIGVLATLRSDITVPATITTAGAATYTAAQLLGGLILRDPNGAGRSDVTPTAALIIAAIDGAVIGSSFEFTIRNDADAAETITVTAGTDVTLSGTMTIAQSNAKRFKVVVTAATTVTIYSLGTVVF